MADVRLTATNPADSSVVPVACNERGELKLEEIPDQSFDGNLDGDLYVSGSISGGSYVSAPQGIRCSNGGWSFFPTEHVTYRSPGDKTNGHFLLIDTSGFTSGNSATTFRVTLTMKRGNSSGSYSQLSLYSGLWAYSRAEGLHYVLDDEIASHNLTMIGVVCDGPMITATFNTSNVRVFQHAAIEYVSTSLLSGREVLKGWAEKNVLRPKPEESSQDEPATRQ